MSALPQISILKRISNELWASMGFLIWSRDIICLHILPHRKKFLCSKICKQIMSLDQMRDPNAFSKETPWDLFLTYCHGFVSFWALASLIWPRDIICLHILLHRNFFLRSKICKQIMSLDQIRDAIVIIHQSLYKMN